MEISLSLSRKSLKTQKSRLATEIKAEFTKVNEPFINERNAEFGVFRGSPYENVQKIEEATKELFEEHLLYANDDLSEMVSVINTDLIYQ